MDISFEHVTVKTKQGKEILSDVSGSVKPGTFTSLMGASGSGKTTLLSTLSRRFEASLFYEGNVRYNGRKWVPRDRRAICFVQQDDIMPTYLTVQEFLKYSARLRLDVPEEVRQERVERVIDRLRLHKCRHTVIGDSHARGVSGGERKRTNIANELLTEPEVVFTDEPTSGLDSTLSNVVIEILKGQTNDGLTVVTTVHSPSSFIFSQFDSLIVLDEGRVFYRGEAKNLVQYINDTLGRAIPVQFNPADYLMDLLVLEKDFVRNSERLTKAVAAFTHLDMPETSSTSQDTVPDGNAEQTTTSKGSMTKRKSTASARGKKLLKGVSVMFRPGDEDHTESARDKKYARSFPVQVYLLTKRLWQKYKKDMFTVNQIGSTLGLAIISGLLFFQMGYSETEIFSRTALSLWLVGTDMYLG
jgi:ABC-type multidrug transport system ATPase subunit